MQRIAISLDQMQDKLIMLTSQQQHYLSRVLRLREGERFMAMDGKGSWWLAQLRGETAEILEAVTVDSELSVAVTLMLALPKGNGFDDVVRCCTELGVSCIVPVVSQRTLLHPSGQKLERWRRIAQEAAEQSERGMIPTILEPVAFESAIATISASGRYICEGRGNFPHLCGCLSKTLPQTIVVAIGPEGGWTDAEIEAAIATGFSAVSLGRRILRAVTAPIVTMSIIAAASES